MKDESNDEHKAWAGRLLDFAQRKGLLVERKPALVDDAQRGAEVKTTGFECRHCGKLEYGERYSAPWNDVEGSRVHTWQCNACGGGTLKFEREADAGVPQDGISTFVDVMDVDWIRIHNGSTIVHRTYGLATGIDSFSWCGVVLRGALYPPFGNAPDTGRRKT